MRQPRYKVGQKVMTDFTGKWTERVIEEVKTGVVSQTGIVYKVSPALPHAHRPSSWIDEAWFHPIEMLG